MIPCKELRNGNYVLADGSLQQITMVRQEPTLSATTTNNRNEPSNEMALESLLPVPLSEEILKRCGFVYHDYFKFWQLIEGSDNDRSEMDIDRDYNILDFMRRPIVKKIASLHQLQNIYFMLKGKELNVRVC